MREKINYRISIIAILTGAIEQAFNRLIIEQARLRLPDGALEDLWTNASILRAGAAPLGLAGAPAEGGLRHAALRREGIGGLIPCHADECADHGQI